MTITRWLAPLLLLSGCTNAPPAGDLGPSRAAFRHLEAGEDVIVTRHFLPLRVSVPSFRTTPESHRVAVFGGHPFEVSLAALLGENEAVMVHAERVADGSGAADYDDLPRATWPDERFGLRAMCAEIDREAAESEHDLDFLARHGWNPVGSLAIEQYLTNSPAHDQEAIVSLVVRVADCADEPAVGEALRRLRERVAVSPG